VTEVVAQRQSIRDLLAAHPFFADLGDRDLDLIAGCGQNRVFRPGQVLFREGDPADWFHVIRRGRIALGISIPGREDLIIDTLGPGEVLGWSWLFPPHVWTMDATALDTVHVIALDGVCLRGKCDDDPALGYSLARRFAGILSDRLASTRLRLLDIYQADPHG